MSVLLTEDLTGGVRMFTLNRPRMNLFNVELMRALSQGVKEAEADSAVRALVIRGSGTVFSAGLDFNAMLTTQSAGQTGLLRDAVCQCYLDVWSCTKPTVAAVTGHAIAAGYFLALACDFRYVMEGFARYGINELLFGAGFPTVVIEIGRWALQRHMAYVIQSAELFDWREGLKNGSFHASYADENQVLAAAVARAEAQGAMPHVAYAHVKAQLIAPYRERVLNETDADRNTISAIFEDPETVQSMLTYITRIMTHKS